MDESGIDSDLEDASDDEPPKASGSKPQLERKKKTASETYTKVCVQLESGFVCSSTIYLVVPIRTYP